MIRKSRTILVSLCDTLASGVTYLSDGHLEVLLSNILSPLPQSVHSSLGTDTSDFGTGTLTHLLGQRAEVDPSLK